MNSDGIHKTKTITLNDQPVEIDTRIVELVQLLNKIPGVRTTGSCEEDPIGPWIVKRGYIILVFDNPNTVGQFAWLLFSGITQEMRHSRLELTLHSSWVDGSPLAKLEFIPADIKELEHWIQEVFLA